MFLYENILTKGQELLGENVLETKLNLNIIGRTARTVCN